MEKGLARKQHQLANWSRGVDGTRLGWFPSWLRGGEGRAEGPDEGVRMGDEGKAGIRENRGGGGGTQHAGSLGSTLALVKATVETGGRWGL